MTKSCSHCSHTHHSFLRLLKNNAFGLNFSKKLPRGRPQSAIDFEEFLALAHAYGHTLFWLDVCERIGLHELTVP